MRFSFSAAAMLATTLNYVLVAAPVAVADLPPLSPVAIASGTQISRAYGHEFVTVGAPGNAGYAGGQFGENAGSGAVAEPFRIARTQVTNQQWADFANAYLPYMQGDPARQWGIIGIFVDFDTTSQRYVVSPGAEQVAASMSWRMAARYCNWLCNDQRSAAASFENGAYDTSTFGGVPGRAFTDQLVHNPGASFYLPTRTEWVKAAFFDPNHSGPGEGGYWTYPNSSDRELRYGFPQDGGESIVGAENIPPYSWYLPVGSYANTQSPWGLLDLSGSSRDWNEDAAIDRVSRFFSGSGVRDLIPGSTDSIYQSGPSGSFADDLFTLAGLRIAATVPTPTCFVAFVVASLTSCAFRKRKSL